MEKITVKIGTIDTGDSIEQDLTREVEFVGEKLGSHTEYGYLNGRVVETRGVTRVLYRAEDGRLLIHINDWSHWVGEPDELSLQEVDEEELGPTGRFSFLGRECGLSRPLTLDEVLGDLAF